MPDRDWCRERGIQITNSFTAGILGVERSVGECHLQVLRIMIGDVICYGGGQSVI